MTVGERKVFVGVRVPGDLLVLVKERISRDPESDVSKYIRTLIRKDLDAPNQRAAATRRR